MAEPDITYDFVESLAGQAEPPHVAAFGCHDLRLIARLARGLWKHYAAIKAESGTGAARIGMLKIFAWNHRDLRALTEEIHRRRCAGRLAEGLPTMAKIAFDEAGDRSAWRELVTELVIELQSPFGLVLHPGTGSATTIRGDLSVLDPLTDDRTLYVLLRGVHNTQADVAAAMCQQRGFQVIPLLDDHVTLLKIPRVAPKETYLMQTLSLSTR